MSDCRQAGPPLGRRRALILFVNSSMALLASAAAGLAGVFALQPSSRPAPQRWLPAGALGDLPAGVPAVRVLSFTRSDGWYRERARETVFLVRDEASGVRAMSATCPHLGCQVKWDTATTRFRCPCHGGVFDLAGQVVEGPPPRPLTLLKVQVDPADGSVLVRL